MRKMKRLLPVTTTDRTAAYLTQSRLTDASSISGVAHKQGGGVQKKVRNKHAKFISAFHKLQALDDGNTAEKMGGLAAYQEFSRLSEGKRPFNCARWVVGSLAKQHLNATTVPSSKKLRLLDVGALGANYDHEKAWMDVTAIDLNSSGPTVVQMDFFELPDVPVYDVVALCLVSLSSPILYLAHSIRPLHTFSHTLQKVF